MPDDDEPASVMCCLHCGLPLLVCECMPHEFEPHTDTCRICGMTRSELEDMEKPAPCAPKWAR